MRHKGTRCRWIELALIVLPVLGVSVRAKSESLAPAELQRRLAPFIRHAVTAKDADAEKASQRLVNLHEAFLAVLVECKSSEDLEVRVRAEEALQQAVLQARLRRVEAMLPEPLAGKFREFLRARPQRVGDLFSRDPNRQIQALRRLEEEKDPRGLAEPVLILCLKHPSETLRAWAMAAGVKKQYRSDLFVEALCDLIERNLNLQNQGYYSFSSESNRDDPPNVMETAFDALRTIRPKHAGERLLTMLDGEDEYRMDARLYLAEALGALRDPALIRRLIQMLPQHPRSHYTRSFDGQSITFAVGDDILLALLRLTDQSPGQYNLRAESSVQYYGAMLGFVSQADRDKAYALFRDWWKKNRRREEFQLPAARSQPTSAPATSRPAREFTPPTDRQAEALVRRVARRTRELVREFSHPNYRHREKAFKELRALQGAMLKAISAGGNTDSPEQRRARLGLMGRMVVSARIQEFYFEQSPESLQPLAALREEKPEAFRAYFGLSSRRRSDALKILAAEDKARRAEGLLIDALQSDDDAITPAALKVLESGGYRSETLRKLLAGEVSDRFLHKLKQQHGYYRQDMFNSYQVWFNALGAVGGEQCLDVLVGCFDLQQWQIHNCYRFLVEAVVKCDDPRVVEMLLPHLKKTNVVFGYSVQGKNIQCAVSDFVLMALIRLTKQDPKQYSFVFPPYGNFNNAMMYGFPDDKTRGKAIEQFRVWYRNRKNPKTPTTQNVPTTQKAK
ncbi:MAG: hypothetical protein JXA11_05220 [Phycisphaerae bacterium]|nr:hypothetical protein [Phycisphaerae bacterium]